VLPIGDFRTLDEGNFIRPSANLLDTIYTAQQRQQWYQAHCRQQGLDKLSMVGKYNITDDATIVAQELNAIFSFHKNYSSWQDALSRRIELIENQGILVMSSGIALGNTHRSLDLNEFRGFALSDEYAPVIFINAKDSIAARSFTLMHELAHIVIAENGVSNTNSYHKNSNAIEKWCDQVAAEMLVPSEEFRQKYQHNINKLDENLAYFAKYFKVSTLVILGRIYDLGYIDKHNFWQLFQAEKNRLLDIIKAQSKKSGGDYYNSKPVSVSKLFIKTITASTLEGKTLYREAMQLLNIKNIKTFNNLTEKIHPWSV
jgi:Zn-dependent peptidase ImmA (M78 family)